MNSDPTRWSHVELTRRRFLQAVGAGAVVGSISSAASPGSPLYALGSVVEAAPIGPSDGVLVLVTLYGGNDGLNTFVPFTNGTYFDARRNLAIDPATCLPADDWYAFNPALPTLHRMWHDAQVAVVHGVGYNPPNRSHFASTANWMSGRLGTPNYSTGWIGRWLDQLPAPAAGLAVAEVGITVPLHLVGSNPDRSAVGIPTADILIRPPAGSRLRAGLQGMHAQSPTARGRLGDVVAASTAATIDLADEVGDAYPVAALDPGFVGAMSMAARLINADVGLRVLSVALDGFDTHAGQDVYHQPLLDTLDRGLAALFATIQPAWRNRVTVATLSEFGRSPHANASSGTDHGTSNVQFVIGANVAGGHYGEAPRLATLDANRQLIAKLDFRTVYANLVDDWLGGDGSGVIGGSAESLGLFAAPPGQASPPPNPAPLVTAGYVPLTPHRVFDTREGTGGRLEPLAEGEVWTFPLCGIEAGPGQAVPGEARSVVLNVTALNASEPTFVTAWNAGAERPTASNLNPLPGQVVPNLVVGRIGQGGRVAFANGHGSVDLLADIVGYFDSDAPDGLLPLNPYRLVDTRLDGGTLGPDGTLELRVVDVGGVPAAAVGVALNVTVTNPTEPSYLTVWPTGEPMPNASSVNMFPGDTVPNLVFARVGTNGSVSIFNRYGTTDVIVDLFGCFLPGTRPFVSITPERLLDTRIGHGAPAAPVVGDITLDVAGVGSVSPAATAVMLNVTAVLPSQPTFITVYPTGTGLPVASNVNVMPDQVAPNMVVATLGAGGRVNLFNGHGAVHLVADVTGYFL